MKSDRGRLFYKNMLSYLIDHRALTDPLDDPKSGNKPCRNLFDIPYHLNGRAFDEAMGEIIETAEARNCLDQAHLSQYARVQILARVKGNPTAKRLFQFLFDLADAQEMSWPAYDILFNRFGEIMTAALPSVSPCDLNDNAQEERLRALVYLLLSDYIPTDLHEDQLHIYGDGVEKSEDSISDENDEEDDDGIALGHVNEEHFHLECCVTPVEKDAFEHILDVDHIAAYADEGLHGENTLIENLITYVNRDDPRQAVTYQIIGKTTYDSAKEMFGTAGAASFGYTMHDAAVITEKIDNMGEYEHKKGAQALWVKRLAFPVIKKDDIRRLIDNTACIE